MTENWSRLLLQMTNGLLALTTIAVGGMSLFFGSDNPVYLDRLPDVPALDSNLRFMGGLGVGLGCALLWLTPTIERRTLLFRVIWLCALAGGIGRLISALIVGPPPTPLLVFTVIEVLGVPLLIYWQYKIASTAGDGRLRSR